MTLKKKITVYIPDELDDWVKNDMPRNINLSEEVRIFLYSLRDKYTSDKPRLENADFSHKKH